MISIGGQTGDYPFYNIISSHELPQFEHWSIQESGNVVDTYDKLSIVFQCSELYFFDRLVKQSTNEQNNHDFLIQWKELENTSINSDKLPFSNAYIASILHNQIPKKSVMQFSILNSLRVWNLFTLDSSIQCYANVGAFGIDGGMSTLIGQSVATDKLCFMVIGDLAFFYDMNSIGIRHIKPNLRILLINNNGGVEFKYSRDDNKSLNRFIAAGNHFSTAEGWAKDCGFQYIKANNKREFEKAANILIGKSDKPVIVEAMVKDEEEVEAYNSIIESKTEYTPSEQLKRFGKRILGK